MPGSGERAGTRWPNAAGSIDCRRRGGAAFACGHLGAAQLRTGNFELFTGLAGCRGRFLEGVPKGQPLAEGIAAALRASFAIGQAGAGGRDGQYFGAAVCAARNRANVFSNVVGERALPAGDASPGTEPTLRKGVARIRV